MCEAIEHIHILADALHGETVIFFGRGKSRSSGRSRNPHDSNSVLADLGLGACRVSLTGQLKPAFVLLKTFLCAQSLIVALVDAGRWSGRRRAGLLPEWGRGRA